MSKGNFLLFSIKRTKGHRPKNRKVYPPAKPGDCAIFIFEADVMAGESEMCLCVCPAHPPCPRTVVAT